jgi:hypothetical protein
VAYEGTPAGELIQALAASPAAPSADAQDDERATLNFTEINDLMRTMQHQPYGIGSRVKDAVTFADAVQRAALARAASPQATVYSLFSSSDRRNFGHLTPQEFVNAVIEAVRAQATATQDTTDYEALEREHLGDADKGTGIYAQTERAAAERAAKALEKSRCQIFEWSDDEFEIWWSKDDRCQRERLVGEALFILRAASLQATARLTDEAILAALRPQLTEADGGYVCDLAQERVIAAGRDLLKAAQLNVGCPDGAKIAAGLGKQIEKPTAKSTPTTAMERTSFETYFHNKGVDPDLGGLEAFREKNAAWDAWEARARLAARPASGGDL